MTPTQRHIGVFGAFVAAYLLVIPPWKLEYERGYSRITYAFFLSPPTGPGVEIGDATERSPQTQAVAVWLLLGELAAVGAVVAFLLWLYRPVGKTAAPGPGPARPAPA